MVILAIALVVAGAALAALGVLRLTRAGFVSMPRLLAVAVMAVGIAVVVFGSLLPRLMSERETPRLALQPQTDNATPQPTARGDIRGAVRSTAGRGMSGVEVALHAGMGRPRTTRTDARGRYSFADLDAGGPYRVVVLHSGGVFQKTVFAPTRSADVIVAPTTKNPAGVKVRAASLAVVGDDRGVQAVYAATLEKSGPDAYVGGVPLPVLAGAQAVEPRTGIDRTELGVQDGVLFSSGPVLPGSTALSYTFVAPVPERGTEVILDTAFPTTRFDLLIAGRLRLIEGARANGTIRLGDRTYKRYTWRNLAARQMVSARIAPTSAAPLLRTAALAAGGLVAAVIVALPLLRRRRTIVPPSSVVPVGQ